MPAHAVCQLRLNNTEGRADTHIRDRRGLRAEECQRFERLPAESSNWPLQLGGTRGTDTLWADEQHDSLEELQRLPICEELCERFEHEPLIKGKSALRRRYELKVSTVQQSQSYNLGICLSLRSGLHIDDNGIYVLVIH